MPAMVMQYFAMVGAVAERTIHAIVVIPFAVSFTCKVLSINFFSPQKTIAPYCGGGGFYYLMQKTPRAATFLTHCLSNKNKGNYSLV